jgi:hypothetical protein
MPNYPYFGMPPTRKPRPVAEEPALAGKRVILSTPEGFVYDMRAVGELRTDGEGGVVVDILSEANYYEARFTHRQAEPVAWPAHLVWVD